MLDPAGLEALFLKDWPVVLIALIAGLARGFSGFGAALIFVPLAGALLTPKVSAPVLLVVDNVMALGLLPGAWRRAQRPGVFLTVSGALVGAPLGTYLLAHLSSLTLRWVIAILALSVLAFLMSGWRYAGEPRRWVAVMVGAVAGIGSGVAQIGGPPVVAYWLGGRLAADTARANLILYFAMSSVLTSATYFWGGLLTPEVLGVSLIAAPAYGLAVGAGALGYSAANEPLYRKVSYGLIALAALLSLPAWDGFGR